MSFKYKIDVPIDSPERTILHGELIKSKKFLSQLYKQWHQQFHSEIKSCPPGLLVELGSGGGVGLKALNSNILRSDIIDLPTNDLTFSALDMPFADHSVAGLFMTDTMHHIPDAGRFLMEVDRVLVDNGKMIMIEPANTLWGRFIFKNFHHESFEPEGPWTIPLSGPLSGANGALPWIVFFRDRELLESRFPLLSVSTVTFQNPLLYLISGGFSYHQFLPDFLFPLVNLADKLLPKLYKQLSMFMLIKVVRMPG